MELDRASIVITDLQERVKRLEQFASTVVNHMGDLTVMVTALAAQLSKENPSGIQHRQEQDNGSPLILNP